MSLVCTNITNKLLHDLGKFQAVHVYQVGLYGGASKEDEGGRPSMIMLVAEMRLYTK